MLSVWITKKHANGVFIGLNKPFDTVDHGILKSEALWCVRCSK